MREVVYHRNAVRYMRRMPADREEQVKPYPRSRTTCLRFKVSQSNHSNGVPSDACVEHVVELSPCWGWYRQTEN